MTVGLSPYRFTTCPVDKSRMETGDSPSADALYFCRECESAGRNAWHLPKNPGRIGHGESVPVVAI